MAGKGGDYTQGLFADVDNTQVAQVEAALMADGGLPIDINRSYVGTVKSFDVAGGRGFIECEDIALGSGKDVYVHRNVLAHSGANVGDKVEFMIHLNPKGLPQAKEPMTILESQQRAQYHGVIKSFMEAKGYGFVTCDATYQLYNRDVFLPHNKATGFRVGQEVIFNITLNTDPSGESKPVVAEMYPAHIEYVDPKVEKAQKQSMRSGPYGGGGGWGGGGCGGGWDDWSWMGKGMAAMAAMAAKGGWGGGGKGWGGSGKGGWGGGCSKGKGKGGGGYGKW